VKRRVVLWGTVSLIVVAAVAAAIGAAVIYSRVTEPFKGYEGPEQFVEIPSGSGAREIERRLISAGLVRDELTFRVALRRSGAATRLKAGEYRFDRPMTPAEVLARIERGEVYLRFITFREGLTIEEKAQVYEAAGFGTAADFIEAARDPSPVAALDPDAPDLEGYLFPETYALPRHATAADLVASMARRFDRVFGPELREAAAARGLSVREVVTLASLVEKETGVPEERTLVSAVFSNRLRIGMRMQCDPTVIYALQKAGRYTGNLTRADLQFDSPYNTYRYAGLPPGPIAAPGKASLEAALAPADSDYLYFVSRNDGSHVFARTLAEHNRNVHEWQIMYFRQKRLEAQRKAREEAEASKGAK
jgi:UPF0755 protein